MGQTWKDALGTVRVTWLLGSEEPWTRYRTLLDLLNRPEQDSEVQAARSEMLGHAKVQGLARSTSAWGEQPLKRHNDASHAIYAFATLADFGVKAADTRELEGLDAGIAAVLAHQAPEGAFQTVVLLPKRFGGTGGGAWTWILCDTPTLLYVLLIMGLERDARVQKGVGHLVKAVDSNGWHCAAAPELGRFRGPGRKEDPCPMANVYALKALAQVPALVDSPATRAGTEMLLRHWECQSERKLYLFGIGTDFRKLKYPFVWYDILHVVDVLSRFTFVHADPRFRQMLQEIARQADGEGRFTASSMYRAWNGWSFADKKQPSPWLTFLYYRILKRVYDGGEP
jgi:hypothetical protein